MRPRESIGAPALLAGREHDLHLLWQALEQVADDGLRVVLTAGELGIGKTRLLHVLATRAAGRGIIVLRGGAVAAEGHAALPALPGSIRPLHRADRS